MNCIYVDATAIKVDFINCLISKNVKTSFTPLVSAETKATYAEIKDYVLKESVDIN